MERGRQKKKLNLWVEQTENWVQMLINSAILESEWNVQKIEKSFLLWQSWMSFWRKWIAGRKHEIQRRQTAYDWESFSIFNIATQLKLIASSWKANCVERKALGFATFWGLRTSRNLRNVCWENIIANELVTLVIIYFAYRFFSQLFSTIYWCRDEHDAMQCNFLFRIKIYKTFIYAYLLMPSFSVLVMDWMQTQADLNILDSVQTNMEWIVRVIKFSSISSSHVSHCILHDALRYMT